MNQQTVAKTPAYAWVILLALYLATLAAPLNQFKVPPVLPILREAFNLSSLRAGLVMSVFSIMGFVLAIPAGFIVQKIGLKATGLIAVGAVTIGSGLGGFATTSDWLLLSRFVEGVGMGLIMVTAPAAIALWFPPEGRGRAMGLWASCVGVGSIAALNLAPALAGSSNNWRAIWWVGTIFGAVAFVLFAVLFRLPRQEEISSIGLADSPKTGEDKPTSMGKAMANRDLWLLSLVFCIFNLVILAWNTFYPDFLTKVRQLSLSDASFITSLMMALAIFSGPLGGYISDRMGSRKPMIVIPFILMGLIFLFPFTITGWMMPALMVLSGVMIGPIAPVILAAVPEVMEKPQLAGIGMAVSALGQNIGMFVGPLLFGWLLGVTSWAAAGYWMIPICAVGIIAILLTKIK